MNIIEHNGCVFIATMEVCVTMKSLLVFVLKIYYSWKH